MNEKTLELLAKLVNGLSLSEFNEACDKADITTTERELILDTLFENGGE